MWFLIVAVITGHGENWSPYRVDIYMERGFTKEYNCLLAADRYDAMEYLIGVSRVDARCEFQP